MAHTAFQSSQRRNFSLISWFSFFGLLVILLISTITSYLLATFLEEHLLRRDAAVMHDFISRIAQHHDPRGYFEHSYARDGSTLNDFFIDISHIPDVARINAFAPDGTVVWSSDAEMVGKRFQSNDELNESLRGELVFEKGDIDHQSKAEHLPFVRQIDWFVENYIPIEDPDNGKIVGVIEVYRIPVALSRSISDGRQLVWGSISLGGLVLFLSLFGVIRRGQHLINSQQLTLMGQTRLATIGEMASSVAHSIRNPIASIRSSAELALEESHQPELSESLEDIISEVDRFDGWIRELLTFTSEAGDPDAVADLDGIIYNTLGAMENRAQRLGVQFKQQLPGALPQVRGDPTLLTQVMNSLIANALDAMPHGGELIVEASASGEQARITLSDTGFGIPAERLEGLFDPLVTHKNGGLGIGLALARQIVQRYGGSIELNSTVGSGTTVTIQLPVGKQVL